MAILFNISTQGSRYYAQVNGESKFYVGSRVSYGDNWGLMNRKDPTAPKYDPDKYRTPYGFWADFITPIADCESKRLFTCINTYDRAFFTFGFLQYAAHVPNGDFVKYFRKVLGSNEASDYFPDLTIANNRITQEAENTSTELETNESTKALQTYLNASLTEVNNREVVNAARFIHLLRSHQSHQDLQVDVGVAHLKEKLRRYSRKYNLDGCPDFICLVVCDIRHQGRAKSSEIIEALNTGGNYDRAFNNLLSLGASEYEERAKTLRRSIKKLRDDGKLGDKKYSESNGDFT